MPQKIDLAAAILLLCASRVDAQTMYQRVTIDSASQLRVTIASGRAILPPRDSGQVGFALPAISVDHHRVGWLALYPNCCTSYPIPMKLVVRTDEKDRVFDGAGLPIWQWTFVDDARRVAYRQAPVHGDAPAHYELRDVETGKLVESFDTGVKKARAPKWVRVVDASGSPPI